MVCGLDWRTIASFTLGIVLLGCGGGGGSNPPPIQTTSVALDSAVPSATAAAVTTITTPDGSSPSSQGGTVSGEQRQAVFASDNSGNVLLAAFSGKQAVKMNAASTSTVLAVFALGSLPDSVSMDEAIADVEGSPSFALLVSAVDQALQSATRPMSSDAVRAALGKVLAEAGAMVGAKAAAAIDTRKQALDFPGPGSRVSSTPQVVVGTGPIGVYVAIGGVTLANQSPIVWSAYTETSTTEALAAASPAQVATGLIGGSVAPTITKLVALPTVNLPNRGGAPYTLTVQQDQASRIANIHAVVAEAFSLAISAIVPSIKGKEECIAKAVEAGVDPAVFAEIASSREGLPTALRTYLVSLASAKNLQTAVECAGGKASDDWANRVLWLVADQLEIGTAYKAVGLGGKILFFAIHYSDEPKTVGLCETPSTFGFDVVPCATSLKLAPLTMAPGAEASVDIQAKAGPLDTFVPTDTVLSSAAEGVGVNIDQVARKVKATAEVVSGLAADESLLDLHASAALIVALPTLTPASSNAAVDDVITLSLVGPSGPIILPSTGIALSSNNPSVADVDQPASAIASLIGGPKVVVRARTPGTATISVSHAQWAKPSTATITVTDQPANLHLTFEGVVAPVTDIFPAQVPNCATVSGRDQYTLGSNTFNICSTTWAAYVRVSCAGENCKGLTDKYQIYGVYVPGACTVVVPRVTLPPGGPQVVASEPLADDFGARVNLGFTWSQVTYGLARATVVSGTPYAGYVEQFAFQHVDCSLDVYLAEPSPFGKRWLMGRVQAVGGW